MKHVILVKVALQGPTTIHAEAFLSGLKSPRCRWGWQTLLKSMGTYANGMDLESPQF